MQKVSRSSKYLSYVRSHVSCISWDRPTEPLRLDEVEGAYETIAHHVRMGGMGGVGLKPSDFLTVPLTNLEHQELHVIGEKTFWEYRGIDPTEVMVSMLRHWCDIKTEITIDKDLDTELSLLVNYADINNKAQRVKASQIPGWRR